MVDILQWTGTRDPAACLSVPAAIQFMEENHWEDVRYGCHDLLHQAIQRICELTGLPPLYPLDSDYYYQMGIAPLPPISDPELFKNRLYDEFHIEIPLIKWHEQHFLRISVQGYNSQSDIDVLLEALEALLYGHPSSVA